MAKEFARLDESLREFIAAQAMFFVATAPSAGGRINLSPKGYRDTFAILDEHTVAVHRDERIDRRRSRPQRQVERVSSIDGIRYACADRQRGPHEVLALIGLRVGEQRCPEQRLLHEGRRASAEPRPPRDVVAVRRVVGDRHTESRFAHVHPAVR